MVKDFVSNFITDDPDYEFLFCMRKNKKVLHFRRF